VPGLETKRHRAQAYVENPGALRVFCRQRFPEATLPTNAKSRIASVCCFGDTNLLDQHAAGGGQQPANIAGEEHNILFMAARTSVYTLKLKVKN